MNEEDLKVFTETIQEQIELVMGKVGHVPHILFKPGNGETAESWVGTTLPDEFNGEMMGQLIQQIRPTYPVLALVSEAWVAPSAIEGMAPSEHPDKVETLLLVVHNHKDSHLWTSSMLRIGEEVILGKWVNTTKDLGPDKYGGNLMQPYEPPPEYN